MLDVTTDGAIRVLRLDRPERLNSFTHELYQAVTDALEGAASDPEVSVVVITGTGRAFSSGADLTAMQSADPDTLAKMGSTFDAMMEQLLEFPKPLLAAVNGLGVGIGVTLLLHTDLVLIDETARLRTPFSQLGVCPEAGSSVLLEQWVGPQQAAWMLLSGPWIDADHAVRIGLALRSCPAGTALEEAMAEARNLAGLSLASLMVTKRLIRAGRADRVRAALVRERAGFGELLPGAPSPA